jgi:hypothetical protein
MCSHKDSPARTACVQTKKTSCPSTPPKLVPRPVQFRPTLCDANSGGFSLLRPNCGLRRAGGMRSAFRLCQVVQTAGRLLQRGFGRSSRLLADSWGRACGESDQFRCISNRNKVRIEIVPTHRKQRRATNSNRNYFRGSSPFNPDAIGISGQAKSEERSFRLRPASAELRRGSLPNSGGEQKSRGASLRMTAPR